MMERFEDLNAVKKKVNQSETGEENSVCPLRAGSDLSKQMEIEAVILASRAAKVSLVTVCLPLGQVRVRSSDCVSRGGHCAKGGRPQNTHLAKHSSPWIQLLVEANWGYFGVLANGGYSRTSHTHPFALSCIVFLCTVTLGDILLRVFSLVKR